MNLELKNLHPNDRRIHFNEKEHTYKVDGKKIHSSVSQVIDSFFSKFDSEYWSRVKAKERLDFLGKKYSIEKLNETQKIISDEWELKRDEAAKKGTLLHAAIEDYYNKGDYKDLPIEFKFFQDFVDKYPKIKPYRSEWRVFDSTNSIAGTIDMVYEKENGDLFIFDWKRSAKIVHDIGTVIKSDFDYGFDELDNITNNSFNKYSLQQILYKYILEENYGKKISSMNLLVLHPRYHTYFHLPIPELMKETKFLIRKAREKSI